MIYNVFEGHVQPYSLTHSVSARHSTDVRYRLVDAPPTELHDRFRAANARSAKTITGVG